MYTPNIPLTAHEKGKNKCKNHTTVARIEVFLYSSDKLQCDVMRNIFVNCSEMLRIVATHHVAEPSDIL